VTFAINDDLKAVQDSIIKRSLTGCAKQARLAVLEGCRAQLEWNSPILRIHADPL
jgi:hypothetical protein